MRLGAPGLGCSGVVMQERQRQRQPVGIGALEAGAADHHVEAMLANVAPDAVPQQFDRALVAIARQHAGAPKFKKAKADMPLDQLGYVELVLGVEAAMADGDVL